MREAGCTSVQEVAFTFANAIAYVESALRAGLDFDEFAPRLSFFYASFSNLIEEVAKFRAARRMWAKLAKDRFGAKDPRSMMLRFHTQTGGSTLTAQQPENNIVRTAIQALAAVLGGTQSLHTNSMDEALALPTEKAVQIALRTQQVIGYESGVADVIDPLGGAYYVEKMTDRIEEEATRYLDRIEDMGGALRAIEMGYQQREIQEASYRYQMSVDNGHRTIVGVNEFRTDEEEQPEILRVRPEVVRRQIERLNRVRAERDNARVENVLATLDSAARSDANLMPLLIECVESYFTIGEICGVLRGVFGEQREYHVF
jgi:methylmalonyl-CoA mutase N-terminal domain/subunit